MRYGYDVVVIGGGAAGLVASKFIAGVGKRVALIEKNRLGGECTLHGCVPSKALIKAARVAYQATRMGQVGLGTEQAVAITKDGVMAHVRSVVESVYRGHRPDILEEKGVRVMVGDGRFRDGHHFEINGNIVSAASFIMCTGSSPFVPPIKGIDSVPYLTNDNLFDLERLPKSMLILGGGPIGIEMAQALHYLGVEVTIVEMGEQILIREDRELRDLLAERLVQQGLILRTETKAVELSERDGSVVLTVEDKGGKQEFLQGDAVLVAVGRKANVEELGLEAAGVGYSPKGIATDRRLCTTAGNIYACGDVVGPYQFSHMAEYQARIAAWNALFPFKTKANYTHYLWCTFTDPEFAHAGLTEEEARQHYGDSISVYRWSCSDVDRAKTDANEFGMSKFICHPSGRLLGAHILGPRAGELIQEAQILKTLGIPFHKLDSVIHVYPTFTDLVKQAAKMSRIRRLQNNTLVKMLRALLR
jgi:pyruvate/2-oxoglutarate dehydrogenase complex dihydrolipoamide dehydrogenase (E3) component